MEGTVLAALGVEFKYAQMASDFQFPCCLILDSSTLLSKAREAPLRLNAWNVYVEGLRPIVVITRRKNERALRADKGTHPCVFEILVGSSPLEFVPLKFSKPVQDRSIYLAVMVAELHVLG